MCVHTYTLKFLLGDSVYKRKEKKRKKRGKKKKEGWVKEKVKVL